MVPTVTVSPTSPLVEDVGERVVAAITGHRHRVLLEQVVDDGTGPYRNGPHTVGGSRGWHQDHVMVQLIPTKAGRTARALLEEDLLDVMLSDSYPPVIRLTVLPTSGAALR